MTLGGDPKTTLSSVLHPSVCKDAKTIAPSSKVMLDKGTPRISDVGYRCGLKEEASKDHSLLVHGKMTEVGPTSISILVKRLPEQRLGWPLLRKAVSENLQAPKNDEARKMSVVQWVMNLPKRVSPSNQPQMDLIKELKVLLRTSASASKWFQYEELQNSTNQFSSGSSSMHRLLSKILT